MNPTAPAPPTPSSPPAMRVKVYAPFSVYYDGKADSLSAMNDTGPFDILPQHKNFMSLLQPGEIRIRRSGRNDFVMKISRGVLHVKSNQATVFLDV